MSEKEMPLSFWAKAVHTAIYIMNRTSIAAIHDITPEQQFTGTKLDVSHLKVFGCIAYVHVRDKLRTKLDPKAKKCIFVGYSLEQKGYRCYNPYTREICVSRDVVFDELKSWYGTSKCIDVEDENDEATMKASKQESCELNGP